MTCKANAIFPTFTNEAEARAAFAHLVADEDYVDNFRFAYHDDATAVAAYEQQREDGCCGFIDRTFIIAGRVAHIGCNYGH